MNKKLVLLPRLSLFLVLLFSAGCASSVMQASDDQAFDQSDDELGTPVGQVVVPEGLSKEEIRTIIAQTFVGREWTVQERSDTQVVGYLKHRGNEATLTAVFSGESIELYCVGYKINRRGERVKPEMPNGWINFIKKDLNKNLNMRAVMK